MYTARDPPSPVFSQVFILKEVKVLCFDTLLQVFILKVLTIEAELLISAGKVGHGKQKSGPTSGRLGSRAQI